MTHADLNTAASATAAESYGHCAVFWIHPQQVKNRISNHLKV
jgi:hypothetical protein